MKTSTRIFYVLVVGLIMGSCSEYQKVLKSTDLDLKYTKAVEYFEDEKYNKAYPLFDELLTLYRGSSKAADVYYYYAYTNFHRADYLLAAYHFKNFNNTFPSSKKAEECAFMVGYCYYLESPVYSLDQSYTYKAINEMQLFVNTYPNSDKLLECNDYMKELRQKLETKSFERAKQYHKTTFYKAAVVAFNSTLNDFPDTQYREEAMFLRLQSAYELASSSVESKQLQRFIEAKTAYFEFSDLYPESEWKADADAISMEIRRQIGLIENKSE